MWQEVLGPHVEAGRLTVIGVVQEQHPDRAKLYKQWRRLSWPIYVDSLNLLDLAVVPVPLAIDESGIVRQDRITPATVVEKFIDQSFPPQAAPPAQNRAKEPNIGDLANRAKQEGSSAAWRDLGDACYLWGHAATDLDRAVEAYRRALDVPPTDGRTQFRLGVALRRRSESAGRRTGDAQAAVERWGLALAANPNQYIWRRRIQQYGPTLDKPYNFYYWVEKARSDILARGETPIALAVEPSGSELAPPSRPELPDAAKAPANPDPTGRINRDRKNLVQAESVVTPARIRPGGRVRVCTTFRLDPKSKPLWNNEADGLVMWVGGTEGVGRFAGVFKVQNPEQPETSEVRKLEFELSVGEDVQPGRIELPAYALYYVCEKSGGKCFYLRNDFIVTFAVDPKAPRIQ